MNKLKEYISRIPRTVSEKYLDDIAANTSFSSSLDHGANGFDVIENATKSTGYYAIKSVSGTSTINAVSNVGDSLTNFDIISGDIIFGNFSSVEVTSGKVLAYIK